jgi:HEAT repeat protein
VEAIMRSESDSERVDAIRYIATNRNQLDLQQVELVLTKALGDRNLSVRRTAILLLPFYDELAKRNVDRLIKETRHDDVFVRIAALDALGSMLKRNHSDPDRSRISEAILALQNDENEAVRDYAKTVLSRPKPPG